MKYHYDLRRIFKGHEAIFHERNARANTPIYRSTKIPVQYFQEHWGRYLRSLR